MHRRIKREIQLTIYSGNRRSIDAQRRLSCIVAGHWVTGITIWLCCLLRCDCELDGGKIPTSQSGSQTISISTWFRAHLPMHASRILATRPRNCARILSGLCAAPLTWAGSVHSGKRWTLACKCRIHSFHGSKMYPRMFSGSSPHTYYQGL